jgi:hypothetical protein
MCCHQQSQSRVCLKRLPTSSFHLHSLHIILQRPLQRPTNLVGHWLTHKGREEWFVSSCLPRLRHWLRGTVSATVSCSAAEKTYVCDKVLLSVDLQRQDLRTMSKRLLLFQIKLMRKYADESRPWPQPEGTDSESTCTPCLLNF